MGNFFDELSDTFSTTNSDNLKRIADQIGGQYESAGALKGQQISVVYGGINILYDIVTFSRGGTIYTRIRAEFKSHAFSTICHEHESMAELLYQYLRLESRRGNS